MKKIDPPPRPADPLGFVLLNEIGIIEQLARARMERGLPDGLKLSHFTVLNHLVRLGDGKSPFALARAFQVTKGAITNTLQKLESRGLIALEPDPRDGRAKKVRLTEAGREMREACVKAAAPFLAELEKAFPGEEVAQALPFLQRLRVFLDRWRDEEEKDKE